MNDSMLAGLDGFRQCWSRTVMSMVWGQWLMLDTGLRATQTVLASEAPRRQGGAAELVAAALERMRKGLPPPREVYRSPYREQIDWTVFPAWARPSDPTLFEGCTHEG
jgi:hypothetical protein